MSDLLDDLKNKWDDAKNIESGKPTDSKALIALSQKKLKTAINIHIKNIAILTLTLIGISSYFLFVAPFQETLSHIGIFLMVDGLFLRIMIECYSIYRSSKLDMSAATAIANEKALRFYAYRKRIHGPVTVVILLAYTIGFYLLTPEFTNHFTTTQVVIMDVSYLVAAGIFGYSIRKAIKDEMRLLNELKHLQEDLVKD